jgi:heptosyltransferase III
MTSAKILVIHQGAIGDLMLSLPAFQTIKNAFPACSFELLGYPLTLALAGEPADTVRSVDGPQLSSLYGEHGNVTPEVHQYLAGFERVFIFSAQDKSALIENVQRCHSAALHISTFPAAHRHVIDFQLAQLVQAGFVPAGPVPHMQVKPDDGKRAEMFLREHGVCADTGLRIAVHPGSGGKRKNWPAQAFLRVMRELHAGRKVFFLILQGPADEQAAAELLAGLAGLPYEKLENFDLPLVAALLSKCALFIGNDSGMAHVAAALDVPTVAVFGPTDPEVWGPRGASVSIVRHCDAAGQWRWPEPEVVLLAARKMLGC